MEETFSTVTVFYQSNDGMKAQDFPLDGRGPNAHAEVEQLHRDSLRFGGIWLPGRKYYVPVGSIVGYQLKA
jgi:hypothetical protein